MGYNPWGRRESDMTERLYSLFKETLVSVIFLYFYSFYFNDF